MLILKSCQCVLFFSFGILLWRKFIFITRPTACHVVELASFFIWQLSRNNNADWERVCNVALSLYPTLWSVGADLKPPERPWNAPPLKPICMLKRVKIQKFFSFHVKWCGFGDTFANGKTYPFSFSVRVAVWAGRRVSVHVSDCRSPSRGRLILDAERTRPNLKQKLNELFKYNLFKM